MPTALITGASSGIGAAFARRLALDEYGLVLVARSRQRMEEARETLQSAGAPFVEILDADLTDPHQRHQVAQRLSENDRPIDLLVNNAGMSIGKDFSAATESELTAQLELNVTAVMLLTHAALPVMKRRRHGGIINIASIAGMLPGRGSTYSASKAWVTSFTEGLAMSLHGTGVRALAVCPGFVETEFHDRAGLNMADTPQALYVEMDTVVSESLEALRAGQVIVVPGSLYKGVALGAKLAPRSLVRKIASMVDKDDRD